MSTDPTTNTSSGLTGDNTTTTTGNNGQEGIVPTVLSYVGLGGNGNTTSEHAPATADDSGAIAGVGASAVAASSAAGAAVQQGHGPAAAAAGAAVAAGAAGAAAYGGSRAGANDAAAENAHLHPHDEDSARSVAARATGGVSGYNDGSGLEGNTGVGADKIRDTTGVGAVNDGSYSSGARSTSGIGSGVGVGSDDTYSNNRSTSGVGSGVGVNDSIGRDNPGMKSSDASTRDSSAGLAGTTVQDETRKTERADDGTATGSEAHESQATTESRSNNQTQGGGSRGKMENKDAIPIAGGVKLGEKHWGESEIIPDNPKPRSDEGVSSSEGQPDQSTRDNTSANTGGASGPPRSGSGEKEGFMDKVKDKLNIGNKD